MDSREIGAEWMSLEMLKRLELKEFLLKKGWSQNKAENAMISIISRAVAAYSENKTESWLRLNSGLLELFDRPSGSVSRHDLYKSAQDLYEIKPELEQYLYNKLKTIFDIEDTILIYDLTNTHFEGRKLYTSTIRKILNGNCGFLSEKNKKPESKPLQFSSAF